MTIHANYINGQWVETDAVIDNINPSNTTDVVGHYARAGNTQVDEAVRAARGAGPGWAHSTPQERFNVLDAVGSEILARKKELGRLLSREEGKTLPEGMGEVNRAGQIFKFFAGEALRVGGEIVPSVRPNVGVEVTREALGVVGIITPWNFPIAIPAWKIAPALAFGNAVVFKPAELAPGCAWALADILARNGLPAGVFNMVMGSGAVLGEALTAHTEVDGVSFTGSVTTGQRVALNCVQRRARVQLEMGGKNPQVVLDDADLDTAVNCAINGAFFSTGQRCTAASRLIVTDGIHDRFVAAMMERMAGLRVDDALKDGTQIGPLVDATQLDKVQSYLEIGREEGATLTGGERLTRDTPGYYMAPALFTGTDNGMRINREEIFGPVATVIRVKDYEEALAVANDTEFGLSSGICTTSLKYATHFRRHAQAGMVMVNLPTAGVDYHVPFGGRKGSSYGTREQGVYAKEFYTIVKTSYIAV